MNSINSVMTNTVNTPSVAGDRTLADSGVARDIGDSVEITGEAPNSETSAPASQDFKMMRLRDLPKEMSKAKEPEKALVTYAVQHPKGVAIAAGVAGVTVAAVGGVLVGMAGNGLSEVVDVVKGAASMSTVKEKVEVFKQAAQLVGVHATAGAMAGAAGLGVAAVLDGVEGTKNMIKGVKKGDHLKIARAARKMNVGLKGTLVAGTVASYGILNSPGPIGAFRSGIMPGLKIATATLNTAVGSLQLVKGIKNKSKKDIIGGALNLGVGIAAGVSMAMGGGIVATACTVFTAARSGFNAINTAVKLHKYAKEAKQEMKAQKQGEPSQEPNAADAAKQNQGTQPASGSAEPVQQSRRADDKPTPEDQGYIAKNNGATSSNSASVGIEALLNSSPEDAIWVDG
ncbi:hypothetical protein IJT17_10220 [bacterium]|nr:hypothetical protein [bacterium]